jgi:hypothetical protein
MFSHPRERPFSLVEVSTELATLVKQNKALGAVRMAKFGKGSAISLQEVAIALEACPAENCSTWNSDYQGHVAASARAYRLVLPGYSKIWESRA